MKIKDAEAVLSSHMQALSDTLKKINGVTDALYGVYVTTKREIHLRMSVSVEEEFALYSLFTVFYHGAQLWECKLSNKPGCETGHILIAGLDYPSRTNVDDVVREIDYKNCLAK